MEPNQPIQPGHTERPAPMPGVQPAPPQIVQPQQPTPVMPPQPVAGPQPVTPAPQPHMVSQPMTAPQPINQQPAATTAPKTRRPIIKKLAIVVAVIVIFAAGYAANNGVAAFNRAQATNTGKAVVAALVNGDSAKVYGYASSDLKKQETASALMQSVGNVKTSNPAYANANTDTSGKGAVYVVTVSNLSTNDQGNTSSTIVVSMVKQGLAWKVNDISVQ